MHLWTRNFLINFLAACVLVIGVSDAYAAGRVVLGNDIETPLSTSTDEHTVRTLNSLRSKAATASAVRVIVGVRAAFAPEGKLLAADVAQQRSEIARIHSAVLRNNPSFTASSGKARAFKTIPFMALEVNASELEALAAQTEITSIEEDRIAFPTLAQSVPLIGGTAARSSGYTGAGQTVAILDTGVDNTHPFLAGKVVSEACYSTNYAAAGASSLCPGGVSQSTAAGAGVNCDPAIAGCAHGTHVAGIAAGNGASFSGVAKDASIIAIKVFTRFDSATKCGSTTPCIGGYTSDINLALERVYLLRSTFNIAAVNMSLGGGSYSDQASCDAANSSTKTAIDNLRSVNIATVIASGNDSSTSKISSPGCISSAVSVGATSKTDVVASYSNSASFLNLLAPGSSINSSIPGGAYATYSGTSMATPHVVGAWAVLKQQNPNITVTDALSKLTTTGVQITDSRNGIVKPRIQIDAALNVASNAPPTLSYSQETGYGSSGVNPSSGTATTTFSYKVVYSDISNIAPASIRVCIDGVCNAMSKDTGAAAALHDGSYTNGEQYVYVTTLAAGAHSYYFDAARGTTTVTLPASGALSGPTVSTLAIGTTALPNGNVGIAYSATLAASGGTPSYSWNAPGLPAGLNINSATGVISGTPTQASAYAFAVTVSDAASASLSAALSINILDSVAPTLPTNIAASVVSATHINLSWTASTDNVAVTGYKVYRNGVQVGTPTATSFSDNGLTSATSYSYTVAACDAAGNCSAPSTAVSATTQQGLDSAAPTVPAGLIASAASATQVNLSWTASTDNVAVTGYKVSRNGVQVGTPTATSFSDTGLTSATSYSYTVAACDAAGNCSAQSKSVSATTQQVVDSVAPTVSIGLAASVVSATQINLSWTASTDNVGVTGYKVYRNGVQVGIPVGTSFSDTGLAAATTYSYTVAACDVAGNCSAQSTAVSATTQQLLDNVSPTVPTRLSASAVSRSQINLTWRASTDNVGVTGYKVFRNGVQIGTASGTGFSDIKLRAATTYRYTIAACDAALNCSAHSSSTKATTRR